MIELMPESAGDALGFRAVGKLTDEDYKQVFIPRLDEALAAHGKLKVMLVLDDGFEGWDLHAMWDDARWGMKHKDDMSKVAVVGGAKWMEWASKVGGHLIKGEVKTFDLAQLDEAWAWVKS
ncbi:MAG: STAS/SEC14 domain-containing protein [Proteobacteria bacterium]|nr:STAS/SEC14 domain-containing protein [Pseudomonadota bacterium]MBU1742796.1 STAS/SEC14 domain-containing protein [Pseudomonadota bacterium]